MNESVQTRGGRRELLEEGSPPPSSRDALPVAEKDKYPGYRQSDGANEPGSGRINVLDAMRRHWLIVLTPVITLVLAGVGLGLIRTPVYTAEGRVSVQVASPYPSAVPSSIAASSGLASIYSRAIYAPPLIRQVSERTSLSPREVMDRISATQVPETGVVAVSATGESEGSTVLLANVATDELRHYVSTNLSGSSPQSQAVFRKYKQAARRYQDRLQKLQELEATSSTSAALRRAEIQVQAAAVKRDGLARAYQTGQQLYTAPLEVVGRATTATSDRASRLQLFVLIGLVAGFAVGAMLAGVQATPRRGDRHSL